MTLTEFFYEGSAMRLLVAMLVAAAVFIPAAAAAPPTIVTHEPVDRSVTFTACGFPVVSHAQGTFTVWRYYDAAGNLVRERLSVQRSYTITLTNPANGKSVSTVLGGPVFVDYEPDGSATQTIVGHERIYIVPGEGPIFSQVGRQVVRFGADGSVETLFEAGIWDDDFFTLLCGYLG
jgi:YD repeat-containing protein